MRGLPREETPGCPSERSGHGRRAAATARTVDSNTRQASPCPTSTRCGRSHRRIASTRPTWPVRDVIFCCRRNLTYRIGSLPTCSMSFRVALGLNESGTTTSRSTPPFRTHRRGTTSEERRARPSRRMLSPHVHVRGEVFPARPGDRLSSPGSDPIRTSRLLSWPPAATLRGHAHPR